MLFISCRSDFGTAISMRPVVCLTVASPPVSTLLLTIFAGNAGSLSVSSGQARMCTKTLLSLRVENELLLTRPTDEFSMHRWK